MAKIIVTPSALRAFAQARYLQWLSKRMPKQREHVLNQRKLFIFPTQQGFIFLLVCALVLISAVNYQNNLAYVVVFFMLSLLNTSILFTFINMSGLKLGVADSEAGFVGKHVAFRLTLSSSSKRQHHQLSLSFKHADKTSISLVQANTQRVELTAPVSKRGVYQADRVRVESTYPLGLIRCWSWVDLEMQALVYPKPISCDIKSYIAHADEGELHSSFQGDDFHGFRAYQPGDSLRQSHWPSLAKGQPLQQKQFLSFVSQTNTLDFSQFHHGNIEETLSKICYAAITLNKKNEPFGLILPNAAIGISSGEKHLHQVLAALATFK